MEVDIETIGKMAREIFGILQAEMMLNKKTVNEINIQTIQVAKDIGAIAEYKMQGYQVSNSERSDR